MAYHTQIPASRMSGPAPRGAFRDDIGSGGSTPSTVLLREKADWQLHPELNLRVSGLPSSTDTWTLKRAFEKEGNIVYLNLLDNHGQRTGDAVVRFSPPPATAFWVSGLYTLRFGDVACNVRVRVEPLKKSFQVQSPIRKHIFYDETMKLHASTLQFGIMLEENIYMPMRTLTSNKTDDLAFTVDLRRKRIMVDFLVRFQDPRSMGSHDPRVAHSIGYLDRINRFRFEMPFGLLKAIKTTEEGDKDLSFLISLDSPPRFFKKLVEERKTHSPDASSWSEHDMWWRHTDIVYNPYALKVTRVALPKERPVIDIGRWRSYRFVFPRSRNPKAISDMMKAALQDFNITTTETDAHNTPERSSFLWSMIDQPVSMHANGNRVSMVSGEAAQFSADLQSLDNGESMVHLPFEVRYQLEVCLSRELINEYNISKEFILHLANMARLGSAKVRSILEYVAEQGKRVYDPMTIFTNPEALAYSPKTKIPHYCGYTRKATVTPTTIVFNTPTVETTNRVTRHYAKENEDGRFLRVQFTDEDFQGRINSNADKMCDDEVYTRVYRTLYNGIQIGDRHYQFLAFGNSQFRENGAYFFCATEHLTCDDIRKWMGNFKHIRVPAKYAARLGQCFSTTRAIVGLSAPVIVKIPDIERNGYNFSDGVGKISSFLAQMIAAELGYGTIPSAFQFRLGGCKGILVVSDDAKDQEVHIRESQQKFAATYNGLEIIRSAKFSSATLNRQTITILSALGVPDNVFLQMLSEQLDNYQSAMDDIEVARTLLLRYIDDNHMTEKIAHLISNGFMACRDPFVLSLLHLWRSWSIKLLKEKAKIIVEEGAFLLGCVDETDSLKGFIYSGSSNTNGMDEENLPQIFVQIPDGTDPSQYRIVRGICLIGRNPSLHPGDIRVVKAIDVPSLHHLRNVVVFPQHGDRDIPSMCSGGDLDGDDFFVIWDKNLRPREWNSEPMDYQSSVNPVELDRSVKVTDLIKFFVRFMKNDALPTIAHNHLAQADYLTGGVKDPKCLELASLHSKAVDYVKTGQPAEMPKRLKVARWPHFMEKKHKPKDKIYHSQKVLGQLYDRVERVEFFPQYEEPFDKRILRAFKLEDQLLKSARQVKSQYDTALRRVMAQHEIATEFEVWTTFVLSKPRVGSDYKIQEDMDVISGALKARFQEVCVDRAGSKEYKILGPFVAAMYQVTKEELDIVLAECRSTKTVGGREVPKRKIEPKNMPLISFPWLFEDVLCRIATGRDVFDDVKDLAILSLAAKTEASQRKCGTGEDDDSEGYIKIDDGIIVHRGEELDIFRPGPDSDELSSDDGESDELYSVQREHKIKPGQFSERLDMRGYDPVVDLKAEQYPHELYETGVEDVVPRTQLDGLISFLVEDKISSTTEPISIDDSSLLLENTPSQIHSIDNEQDNLPAGTDNKVSIYNLPLKEMSEVRKSQGNHASVEEEEVILAENGPESSLDRLARLMKM
ncbi:RNA-dependent RNA polymerase [Coleophoma cylindrospora]|uniref:RNA-dependent RNA polymerase n=1 Tax=Coleophoma cylindrospora TaxID=1849047 RepID=A0A3D8RTK7_9HELO|nr:RNA-dependent RNA polymerase [Coleophoma cylindrospora]